MAKVQVIQPGYYAAICLVAGTAPQVCYIGLVQVVDDYGIRLNPVHWDYDLDVIAVSTEDLFVPWTYITSMLVCTDKQPSGRFVRDRAPEWQEAVEAMQTSGTAPKATKTSRKKEKEA
jgi:hypothetical protein